MALTWTRSCLTHYTIKALRMILLLRLISKTRSTLRWPSASVYGGGCLPICMVPVRFQKPLNTICQNTLTCQCAVSVTAPMAMTICQMSGLVMKAWTVLLIRSRNFWKMALIMVRKNSLVRFGCTVSMMMTVCARSSKMGFNLSVFVHLIWIHLLKAGSVKIR